MDGSVRRSGTLGSRRNRSKEKSKTIRCLLHGVARRRHGDRPDPQAGRHGGARNAPEEGRRCLRNSYFFGALGSGGARRSASEMTAIERAPFLPTDRTAKK